MKIQVSNRVLSHSIILCIYCIIIYISITLICKSIWLIHMYVYHNLWSLHLYIYLFKYQKTLENCTRLSSKDGTVVVQYHVKLSWTTCIVYDTRKWFSNVILLNNIVFYWVYDYCFSCFILSYVSFCTYVIILVYISRDYVYLFQTLLNFYYFPWSTM